MNNLLAIAKELQDFCDNQGWRSAVIGGLAVIRWGQPRFTQDVDVTLLTGFGREEQFIDTLLSAYAPRAQGAREFAMQRRVLLLASAAGIGIDIALGALPFEESLVSRATPYEFEPGVALRTCSAEDLLVMKLFAGRAIDLRDAESIAVRNKATLDWRYVEKQLSPLAELKYDPAIMDALKRLRAL